MSARDEATQIVAAFRLPWIGEHDHIDREMLGGPVVDALIAAGWRKMPSREEIRDAVAEFICDEYIQGQLFPADYGAADAVLALMEGSDG